MEGVMNLGMAVFLLLLILVGITYLLTGLQIEFSTAETRTLKYKSKEAIHYKDIDFSKMPEDLSYVKQVDWVKGQLEDMPRASRSVLARSLVDMHLESQV